MRRAATGDLPAGPATDQVAFTEPNLTFTLIAHHEREVTLSIGLDLEFSPPWRKRIRAGNAFQIVCRLPSVDLLKAADDWDAESAPFPP